MVLDTFRISPLIRITLLSLYLALTVPLPFLAIATQTPISPTLFWGGIAIGFGMLYGVLCERVEVDEQEIRVTYPAWVRPLGRRGWSLPWAQVCDLQMRTTGQGGLVYYFVTPKRDRAYLLPMRVVGFARLVEIVTALTGLDTSDVRPLAQPWMYLILLGVTVLLFLVDGWVVWTAIALPNGIGAPL
jgi:hypothetical protein